MAQSIVVGYVRKSRNGKGLKVNVSKEAFERAQTYQTKNGEEYVALVINLEKLMDLISGERDFVTLNQIINEK